MDGGKEKNSIRRPGVLRTAIRNMILAQAVGAVLFFVLNEGGVLALFILTLGGSELEIGVLAMIMNGAIVTGLIPMAYLDIRSRKSHLLRWLFISWLFVCLIFASYPVYLLAGPTAALWFVVLVISLFISAFFVGHAAWIPYMTDLIPSGIRGRYLGRMRLTWRVTSFAAIVTSGWILGERPSVERFFIVFAIIVFLQGVRLIFVRRFPDLPPRRTGKPDPFWKNFRHPLSDVIFRRFLLFASLLYLVHSATIPFFVPFLNRELGFPSSFTVYASSSIGLGAVLSLTIWGRLSDRWGSRFVFLLGILLLALGYSVFLFVPGMETGKTAAFLSAALGFLLTGMGFSGFAMAYTVRMMVTSKESHRGVYMVICNFTTGVFMALGPLITGWVLERVPETTNLFGGEYLTKRVFFAVMTLLLLLTVPLIKLLIPVRERGLREILRHYGKSVWKPFDGKRV